MADPVAIINRLDSGGFVYFGSTTLAAGESCIVWVHGFPSVIGVIGTPEGTVAYTVGEITETEADIRGDSYTPILLAEVYTTNQLVQGKWGVSAYKITNNDGSDPIKVNWRIVRP